MDLTAAARAALLAMIDWLEAEHGLSRPAAYCLCSACVDLHLSEVVDIPYPLVSALIPLDVFEEGATADEPATAIASISISSSGSASEDTSTIVSAGYGGVNHLPRSSTIFGKLAMSVRKMLTLTTRSRLDPPASSTLCRFRNTCSAWASKSPTPTSPPGSSIAA